MGWWATLKLLWGAVIGALVYEVLLAVLVLVCRGILELWTRFKWRRIIDEDKWAVCHTWLIRPLTP